MSSATDPSFIKFQIEPTADRMKVPSAFREHMKGKKSGVVYLRGPSGNRWSVELVEQRGKLYFTQGWHEFVKDHAIQLWHFLVFEFDGNHTFEVGLYDRTACEDEAALDATPSRVGDGSRHQLVEVKEEKQEEEDAENTAGRGSPPAPFAASYPSFERQLPPYSVAGRRSQMQEIPRPFFRDHMSHIVNNTPIRLQWEDKEWMTRVSCGERHYICKGWREFVAESRVQAGDSCKFELLGQHLLRVTILKRAKEE